MALMILLTNLKIYLNYISKKKFKLKIEICYLVYILFILYNNYLNYYEVSYH